MTKPITILAGIALSAILVTGFNVPDAAADVFLKLGEIKGESTDAAHKEWIDIESISWEASKKPTKRDGQFKEKGPVLADDMKFSYAYEKASPKILEALASGKVFDDATVELTKQVPGSRICVADDGSVPQSCDVPYLRYEMEKLRVSSYQTSGSADDIPTENVTLNFEKIKVTYSEYDDQGNLVSETTTEVKVKGKKILEN